MAVSPTSSSSTAPTFRASGLASGIDSASIIDSLVGLQTASITKLKNKQMAIDVQISSYGSMRSKLGAFETAVKSLSDNGAHGSKLAQAALSADVTLGAAAVAGRFSLDVTQLAQAAKVRTAAQSPSLSLAAGTLHIDADGTGYDVAVTAGMGLAELATALKDSGAPVTANVINDGTNNFLSLARTTTGFTIGGAPASALAVSGTTATALGFANVTTAQNAQFSIDGLPMERRSNTVDDAMAGVTLTLKQKTTASENVVIADDNTATKTALQKVVDAFNSIVGDLQSELDIKANTDRTKTLAGDPTTRLLQSRMHALLTQAVGTGAGARTLADLGLKTDKSGALTIDDAAFTRVVARDAQAVDRIVSGVTTNVHDLVSAFTDSVNGALIVSSKGLTDKRKRMDDQISEIQTRADAYRERLVAQFSAMENVVSKLKSVGNFLDNQSAQQNKSGG